MCSFVIRVRPFSTLLSAATCPQSLPHTSHTSTAAHPHWTRCPPPLTPSHHTLTRPLHTSQLTTAKGDVVKSRLARNINRKAKARNIKEKEIQVIDETGKNLGLLSTDMAVQMALGHGLELTQLKKESQNSSAVYKFVSRKQLYEEKKEQKQQAKKDPLNVIKTVQISTNIGEHDLGVKLYRVEQFLAKNHTVRITIEGKFPKYFTDTQVAQEKKRRAELLSNAEKKLAGVGSKVMKEVAHGRNLNCDFRPVQSKDNKQIDS